MRRKGCNGPGITAVSGENEDAFPRGCLSDPAGDVLTCANCGLCAGKKTQRHSRPVAATAKRRRGRFTAATPSQLIWGIFTIAEDTPAQCQGHHRSEAWRMPTHCTGASLQPLQKCKALPELWIDLWPALESPGTLRSDAHAAFPCACASYPCYSPRAKRKVLREPASQLSRTALSKNLGVSDFESLVRGQLPEAAVEPGNCGRR